MTQPLLQRRDFILFTQISQDSKTYSGLLLALRDELFMKAELWLSVQSLRHKVYRDQKFALEECTPLLLPMEPVTAMKMGKLAQNG